MSYETESNTVDTDLAKVDQVSEQAPWETEEDKEVIFVQTAADTGDESQKIDLVD